MSYREGIPAEPFARWLNERIDYWTKRLDFADRRVPVEGELSPIVTVCRELGWPEDATGVRRVYRMRHQLADSAIGKKNGQPGTGVRTVQHTPEFNRRTVEEALHHAGIRLGELYPHEALVDEFAMEYLVPRDLAARLADAWIEKTWQAVWQQVGLFVSEEDRPQCYCRECKRTTKLFVGACDSCGAEHSASMVAAVTAAVVRPTGLPVTQEILAQARWLREQYQMPYRGIAAAMAVYHGVAREEGTWRNLLRNAGVAAKPHGVPFEVREAS